MRTANAPVAALRAVACLLLVTTTTTAQIVADFTADVVAGDNPLTVQFSDASTGSAATIWMWDFGDGGSSTQANPSHTYTAPGSYTVTLSAVASLFDFDSETKPGFINVDPAPQSTSFTATPTSGVNPLTVQFSDTSSGALTGWLWDFGDGSSSTEQHPSHSFSALGSAGPTLYTVSLTTFIGGQSQTSVASELISVAPALLQADFTAAVTSGSNPLQVQFIDRSLGAVDSWHWDFGDGGTSDAKHGFHIFTVQDNAPTTWDVSLTVSIGGQLHTKLVPDFISVDPAALVLDVAPAVTEAAGHLDVQLANLTPLPEGTQYTWDFGDGKQSTLAEPQHSYYPQDGQPASYDVMLTTKLWAQVETRVFAELITVAPRLLGAWRSVEPALSNHTDGALADWDGDGDLDALVTDNTSPGLVWFANLDGAGSFGPGQALLPDPNIDQLEPADLNGDGHTDLFLRGGSLLAWLPGDGAGGAGALQTLPTDVLSVVEHTLADMEGDGDLDIVGRIVQSGGVRTLEWRANLDGAGSFGPAQLITQVSTFGAVAAGDLDGDGDADVVHVGNELRWEENLDGLGGAWLSHGFAPALPSLEDMRLADLEGDGDLDVLVTARFGNTGFVGWFRNAGQGHFAFLDHQLLPAGTLSREVSAADLDQDGDLDLLAIVQPAFPQRALIWFEQLDGQLGFGPAHWLSAGLPVVGDPEAGDLDGDGDLDLLVHSTAFLTGNVGWVENTLVTPDWSPLGPRLAGAAGPPLLQGFGALSPGDELTLALSNVAPGSVATLVLGLSALQAPFKGGVLVPNPDVLVPLTVGAGGDLLVQASWPGGVPPGLSLFAQQWIVDGSAPAGLSASNGLVGVTTD